MPLTFSHPAAILPLTGRRLPTAALVVGSMAPDLYYFVRMVASGRFGHTLLGLFVFCLPVGLVVLWIVDRILWEPMAALAPDGLRERLAAHPRPALWTKDVLGATALAVLLGAVTHDLWDAFTHGGTWASAAIPALRQTADFGSLGTLHLYEIAQHASTAFGLIVLFAAGLFWWRRAPRTAVSPGLPTASRIAWLSSMAAVGAAAGLTRGVIRLNLSASVADLIGTTIVVSTAVAFWLAVAYSLAVRHRTRRGA